MSVAQAYVDEDSEEILYVVIFGLLILKVTQLFQVCHLLDNNDSQHPPAPYRGLSRNH